MANEFRIKTGLVVSNLTYPNADNVAGSVIRTDGAGNLSLAPISAVELANASFTELSDVNIATGAGNDGFVVYWDNTEGKFKTKELDGPQNIWGVMTDGTNSATAADPIDIFTFTGGTGINVEVNGASGSEGVTITNTSPNVDQHLWKTISADNASATATTPNDTLAIVGGTDIETIITGNTLTINYNSSAIQNNLNATLPPTVTNDSSEGYAVGSVWIDVNADEAYRLVDATDGAAVWVNTTVTATDLSSVALSGDYSDLINRPNIWSTFNADTGSVTSDTENDTFVFSGSDGVTTSISGKDLTIGITSGTYLTRVLDDNTPQLGGNLNVNNFGITTTQTNGNITLTPNGTGSVVLSGLSYPTSPGTNGQVLTSDGSGNVAFEDVATTLTDLTDTDINTPTADQILTYDGTNWINQTSNKISEVVQDTTPQLGGNLDINGKSIVSTSGTNDNIVITPDGTGKTVIGGITYTKREQITITNNSSNTVASFSYVSGKAIFIDYIVERNSNVRTGTLHIACNSTTVNVADSGSSLGDIGVSFNGAIAGSIITISYTSTDTGQDGSMKFYSRWWI